MQWPAMFFAGARAAKSMRSVPATHYFVVCAWPRRATFETEVRYPTN